ncbi:MAG: DUF3078 domain-containing protein [Bacteroidota bacterium]|nr:DUF3078 domain-containing protein [Bacteroidota bacterium]
MRLLYVLLFFGSLLLGFAQPTQLGFDSIPEPEIEEPVWTINNEAGFDISQVAYINWNIGGNNSIAGLLKSRFERNYKKGMFSFMNELVMRYGINKQEGRESRKTDDIFQIVSTVGYKMDEDSKWYYSSKSSFNTQFTNGYSYPNTHTPISQAFAPAYFFFGFGADYIDHDEQLRFYLSPLTAKSTMVFNQRLADQGAFGVKGATYDEFGERITKGKLHRTEIGILVTNNWKTKVYDNIFYENKISLFTDYFNKFGNIDIDWQILFEFIINKYVKASINAHLIYDHDVKTKREIDGKTVTFGPKLQIKESIGIGLTYNW